MKILIPTVLTAVILTSIFQASAQDSVFARNVILTLASPEMEGRGYVNNGDTKAAAFIAQELQSYGVEAFGNNYLQRYNMPMNTFPGQLEAKVNDTRLVAGTDFQVWAATPDMDLTGKVIRLDGASFSNPSKRLKITKRDFSGKFILIDKKGITDKSSLALIDSMRYYNFNRAAGYIFVSDSKLVWSVMIGYAVRNYTVIDIRRNALPTHLRTFTLKVDSEFNPAHEALNVMGFVKGKVQPDTFLIFTAHYDHLGRQGANVYYPGANDNASGTAMVMDLAKYYAHATEKPYYSMAFILLSGEEAGLLGARYCSEHPPVTLSKVKFLINLDMVGTGSEGITMVNATKFPDAYQRMVRINADNEYILTVKERGESCNSDHCPFYQKGVPAVFIYSLGKEFTEYHNPDDKANAVPLSEYSDIFRLMRDFMDSFGKQTMYSR